MRKSVFEKTVGEKLQSGLSGATPDVWTKIEKTVRGADASVPESAKRRGNLQKRRIFRITAAATAVAVCAAGVWAVSYWRPFVQANAQTVYDSGGHLSSVETSAPDRSFVDSYNSFGLELLKQTYQDGGTDENRDVFQSPASVYLALGMTYNGAKEDTAAEFAKVLGNSGKSLDQFDKGCAGLQGLLTGRFRLANSIWLNSPFAGKVNSGFLSRDKTYFGASVSTLNLASCGASELINRWVKGNTNGRIDPKFRNFDSDTVMLLINTIYFKSDWQQKFNANNTCDDSFHSPSGDKTVKFMHGTRSHYIEDGTLQGILLPYDDGKTSMLILLPKKDMSGMLGKLTASGLAAYVANSRNSTEQAAFSLPRVNFSCDEFLKEPLKAMGLKLPFDPAHANFTGMASADLPLYISKVRHMTYLAIDENGTEAAAATAVAMAASSSAPPKNVMNVDRPFVTAIVNNDTGAVLFSGVVNDPSASK